MKRIAIFASGSGTNAQRIIEFFVENKDIQVFMVLSNKKDAFVLERARKFNIPVIFFTKDLFYNTSYIVELLQQNKIDLVVLAGFLWLVPENLINAFNNKIINIHPALLPKYGGKGMFGMNIHTKVYENKENETGITIHYVNKEYDKGNIILQCSCKLDENDTPDKIAEKIHQLEYKYFPEVIAKLLS